MLIYHYLTLPLRRLLLFQGAQTIFVFLFALRHHLHNQGSLSGMAQKALRNGFGDVP